MPVWPYRYQLGQKHRVRRSVYEVLRDHMDQDAAHILNEVREDVRVFTDDTAILSDDITMVVLKGV